MYINGYHRFWICLYGMVLKRACSKVLPTRKALFPRPVSVTKVGPFERAPSWVPLHRFLCTGICTQSIVHCPWTDIGIACGPPETHHLVSGAVKHGSTEAAEASLPSTRRKSVGSMGGTSWEQRNLTEFQLIDNGLLSTIVMTQLYCSNRCDVPLFPATIL